LSHDEDEDDEQGGTIGGCGEGDCEGEARRSASNRAAPVLSDHEFTIGDDDDDEHGHGGADHADAGTIRGARSASLDSVGDVLKNATGRLSPDTAGSQESPPSPNWSHQVIRRSTATTGSGHQPNRDLHPPILGALSYPDPAEERRIVESFWRLYDDHVILSIFGILGILFRILASSWFRTFDDAFNETSALFTNLPLNCLSCFIMGLLCSGDEALKILYTRSPLGGGRYSSSSIGGGGGVGAAKKDDDRRQAPALGNDNHPGSNRHEDEFVPRESGTDADEYVARGGRPTGTGASSVTTTTPPVTSPVSEIRQRHSGPMDRIRAGGRSEIILEVITGGTPEAEDADPDEEVREVQLMALKRRIQASKSLILFPAKKEDVDVMDHYFDSGGADDDWSYGSSGGFGQSASFESRASAADYMEHQAPVPAQASSQVVAISSARPNGAMVTPTSGPGRASQPNGSDPHAASGDQANLENAAGGQGDDGLGLDRMVNGVTENLTRLAQVDITEGWDVGTTPEAMSDDLLLGLRVGFCGCLSTFSSWNSSMINLLWNGYITQALVGYAIGIQLPIISYRAGQHAAVYWFVWRRRREVKRAERRGGYGLRLRGGESNSDDEDEGSSMNGDTFHDERHDIESNFDGAPTDDGGSLDGQRSRHSLESANSSKRKNNQNGGRILLDDHAADRTTPSVRAIATAVFLLMITLLINSLFFLDDTQTSISLLFSPFGVLARWRLMRLNKLRPGFPLGTFTCNMLGCALSGSLGSLLAGNPGPEESMVVQSMIQGFAGSLSSLAAFVVELLCLIDPIIFKYDGIRYAVLTICWALVVGFITSQAKDWADKV